MNVNFEHIILQGTVRKNPKTGKSDNYSTMEMAQMAARTTSNGSSRSAGGGFCTILTDSDPANLQFCEQALNGPHTTMSQLASDEWAQALFLLANLANGKPRSVRALEVCFRQSFLASPHSVESSVVDVAELTSKVLKQLADHSLIEKLTNDMELDDASSHEWRILDLGTVCNLFRLDEATLQAFKTFDVLTPTACDVVEVLAGTREMADVIGSVPHATVAELNIGHGSKASTIVKRLMLIVVGGTNGDLSSGAMRLASTVAREGGRLAHALSDCLRTKTSATVAQIFASLAIARLLSFACPGCSFLGNQSLTIAADPALQLLTRLDPDDNCSAAFLQEAPQKTLGLQGLMSCMEAPSSLRQLAGRIVLSCSLKHQLSITESRLELQLTREQPSSIILGAITMIVLVQDANHKLIETCKVHMAQGIEEQFMMLNEVTRTSTSGITVTVVHVDFIGFDLGCDELQNSFGTVSLQCGRLTVAENSEATLIQGTKQPMPCLRMLLPRPFGQGEVAITSAPPARGSIKLGAVLLTSGTALPDRLVPRALLVQSTAGKRKSSDSDTRRGRSIFVQIDVVPEESDLMIRFVEHWKPPTLACTRTKSDTGAGRHTVFKTPVDVFASVEGSPQLITINMMIRLSGMPVFRTSEINSIVASLPNTARVYPGLITGQEATSLYWLLKGPTVSGYDFSCMLHSSPGFGANLRLLRCPKNLSGILLDLQTPSTQPSTHLEAIQFKIHDAITTVQWSLSATAYSNYTGWMLLLHEVVIPQLLGHRGQHASIKYKLLVADLQSSVLAIAHFYDCFRLLVGEATAERLMPQGPEQPIPAELSNLLTMAPRAVIDRFASKDAIFDYVATKMTAMHTAGHLTPLRGKAHHYLTQDVNANRHQLSELQQPSEQKYKATMLGFYDPGVSAQHIVGSVCLQRLTCFIAGDEFDLQPGQASGDRQQNPEGPVFDRSLNGTTHLAANIRCVKNRALRARRDAY